MHSINRGESVENKKSLSSYIRGCDRSGDPPGKQPTRAWNKKDQPDDFVPKTQCASLEEFIRSLQAQDSMIGDEESTLPTVVESSSSERGDSSVDDEVASAWSSASTEDDSESTDSEATESGWSSASSGDDSESTVSEASKPHASRSLFNSNTAKTAKKHERSARSTVTDASKVSNNRHAPNLWSIAEIPRYSKPKSEESSNMPIEGHNETGSDTKNTKNDQYKRTIERPTDFLPLQSSRKSSEKRVTVSDTSSKNKSGSRVLNRPNTLHMSLDLSSALKDCDLNQSLDLSRARQKYGDSVDVSDFGFRAFNRPDDWVGGSATMMGPSQRSWRAKVNRSRSQRFF